MLPCVIFEDEHLLAVDKPAGLNTHAPGPFAGEGIYDWLRHREPRWSSLAIIHRLDKETSGIMVFGKTVIANRSLTEQFTQRGVRKRYLLLTDRPVDRREFTVKSKIGRAGDRYESNARGELAETRFRVIGSEPNATLVEAEPLTGRTHQIRVHAAENGFPIFGDALYGGTPAARVFLRAQSLSFKHPATGQMIAFESASDFSGDPRIALRAAILEPDATNICRLVHGASDGWPGWYVDRLGDYLLSQSELELADAQRRHLQSLAPAKGIYHKLLNRQVRRTSVIEASPQLFLGEAAPDRFVVRENGLEFELSFNEGYSVGLFLDQRDNRRRLLTGHIAAGFPLSLTQSEIRNGKSEILNAFAYTCGFSVAGAKAGARVTSLDLSKKYLDWGRRNFALNDLDPAEHDFIFGDVFDWLRRLAKKGRTYDAIVLDPPTFSQSKQHGAFRAEKDYGRLVKLAVPLLNPRGVMLASTNAAGLLPEKFLASLETAVRESGRKILQQHYVPQPPDFPITRAEPAYLKTTWMRVE